MVRETKAGIGNLILLRGSCVKSRKSFALSLKSWSHIFLYILFSREPVVVERVRDPVLHQILLNLYSQDLLSNSLND